MQSAILKQMSLRQYLERGGNMSLLFTFLSASSSYFHLTYALKGTYKVLNQLSLHLHQDISWWQLKELASPATLHVLFSNSKRNAFSLPQEKTRQVQRKSGISFKWEPKRPKRPLDYQEINLDWNFRLSHLLRDRRSSPI